MNSTRRTFLKAAAASPLILPSSVWSAPESINSRITMGFIGMGIQSRGLLQHFLHRTQVLAVCDVDTTRREDARLKVDEFYTRYPEHGKPGCAAYNDFEELLARSDIDAVCIVTPDHWHEIMTQAALKAGKDVYCEKPLTHNIAEAKALMTAVDTHGRILQTGSMQRSSREFRVACELARNGVIGKIQRIECNVGNPPVPCDLPEEPLEPGLDWNLWLGPAPLRGYNSILSPSGRHDHFPKWRLYREYGGGSLADWAAHHVDIAQWAMGRDDSGPVRIIPPEDPQANRGVRLVYDDGIEVVHVDGFGVHIFGTDGQIRVNREKFWLIRGDETFVKFTQKEDGGTLGSALTKVEREFLKDAKVQLYRVEDSHVDDFLRSLQSRKKPIAHEQIGARTAICCHLMNLAYRYQQVIEWDPVTCCFANETGNPEWLTEPRRDYRKKV